MSVRTPLEEKPLVEESRHRGRRPDSDSRRRSATSSQVLLAVVLVPEGDAVRATDGTRIQRVADAYSSLLDWPLEVRDGAVFGPNAPTAGPPPYAVFEVVPKPLSASRTSPGPRKEKGQLAHSARPAGASRTAPPAWLAILDHSTGCIKEDEIQGIARHISSPLTPRLP